MKKIFVTVLLASALFSCRNTEGTKPTDDTSSVDTLVSEMTDETVDSITVSTVYYAIRDAKAYLEPQTSSEISDEYSIKVGEWMTSMGAGDFTPFNDEWYLYDWKGLSFYFKQSDFKKVVYECMEELPADFIGDGLSFEGNMANQIHVYPVDLNGYSVDNEEYVMDDKLYVLEYKIGESVNYQALTGVNGMVKLSGVGARIHEGGDISSGKLTEDAFISISYDVDYYEDYLYLPADDALLCGGDVYKRMK